MTSATHDALLRDPLAKVLEEETQISEHQHKQMKWVCKANRKTKKSG